MPLLAMLTSVALVVSACSGGGGSSEDRSSAEAVPQRGGKLVYSVEFDHSTWAPFLFRWLESGQVVAQAFYEPLATFDENGAVKPYLAQSITPNADYTEWTIGMRPGVRFHSGEPLDAAAVKLNLEKQGVGTGSNMSPLDGITAVEVIDPMTVRLRSAKPWASLPVQLTGQYGNQVGYMASPKLIAADKAQSEPDGTGPFVLDSWEPGVRMTAKRNPSYWQQGLPYLDAIEFRFNSDHEANLRSVGKGDIDVASGNGSTDVNLDQPDTHVVTGGTDQLESMVVLNTAVAPLDDHRVREALARATDVDALMRESGRNTADKATGPFSSRSPWFSHPEYPGFDPARARQLISEVVAEKGAVKIELTGWSTPEFVRMQQQLAEQWRAVGIDVTLKTTEQKSIPTVIAVGTYQAALFQKYEGPDPDSYGMFILGSNINPPGAPAQNFSRISDPDIDMAVQQGRSTPDVAQRKAAYTKLQSSLNAYLPFIWLYHSAPAIVASNRVHGLGQDLLADGTRAMQLISGRHMFTRVWVDRGASQTSAG